MDEPRVDPQRNVVQEHLVAHAADIDTPLDSVAEGRERRQRIVGIEADVVREVVARAPRDAGEGQVSLDGHLRNRAQRAVASGHAEHLGIRFPRELGKVVVLPEHVNLHVERLRGAAQLFDGGPAFARARVDEEKSRHSDASITRFDEAEERVAEQARGDDGQEHRPVARVTDLPQRPVQADRLLRLVLVRGLDEEAAYE